MRFGVESKRMFLVLVVALFVMLGNACAQTKEEKMKQIKEHEEKARQFRYQGNLEGAVKEQQKAVDIDPNNVGSLVLLGSIYLEKKDWKKTVEILNKAAAIEPNDAVIHDMLGGALENLGNNQKSLEHTKKAVELEPENVRYLTNLGAAYSLIEDKTNERKSYEKALRIDPKYVDAIYGLALLEEEEGNIDKAIFLFNQVVQSKTEDEEIIRRTKEKLNKLEKEKINNP